MIGLKRWCEVILVLLGLVLLACGSIAQSGHEQSLSKRTLSSGRIALADSRYSAAESSFNRALQINPEASRAKKMLSQTQFLVSGERDLRLRRLGAAESDLRTSLRYRDSATLTRRGRRQLKLVRKNRRTLVKLDRVYETALKLNYRADYRKSNRTLAPVLSDRLNRNSIFKTPLGRIKKLKSANSKLIRLSKRDV